MEYVTGNKKGRSFRELLLDHLNKVLELSTNEFRGGYTEKRVIGNQIEEVYVPDARKIMIQSIEFMGYVLEPYFNEGVKKEYNKIEERVDKLIEQYNSGKLDYEEYIMPKFNLRIKLFRLLNALLFDKGYLAGGDNYEDLVEDEGEPVND